ncbi:MAG: DUF4350 domain-containing protein [Sphingomonadaceae bacterium]
MKPPHNRNNRHILIIALMLIAGLSGGVVWWYWGQRTQPLRAAPVVVMSSLPLYWPESDDFGQLLGEGMQAPWPRAVMEKDYLPEPVDSLTTAEGASLLPDTETLLFLAQPRALSADENIALDTWVRSGGHVLLLADPLLMTDSTYPLGDPRRPLGSALLSPVLQHWGVELTFDAGQDGQWRMVHIRLPDAGATASVALPVRMAGAFRLSGSADDARCTISQDAVSAYCKIGSGQVMLIADADFLGGAGQPETPDAEQALTGLLDMARPLSSVD